MYIPPGPEEEEDKEDAGEPGAAREDDIFSESEGAASDLVRLFDFRTWCESNGAVR